MRCRNGPKNLETIGSDEFPKVELSMSYYRDIEKESNTFHPAIGAILMPKHKLLRNYINKIVCTLVQGNRCCECVLALDRR